MFKSTDSAFRSLNDMFDFLFDISKEIKNRLGDKLPQGGFSVSEDKIEGFITFKWHGTDEEENHLDLIFYTKDLFKSNIPPKDIIINLFIEKYTEFLERRKESE